MTAKLPSAISGLDRWWKAGDIAQADGSSVSSWPAATGGTALTQGTGSKQPVLRTSVAALTGLPAVDFDGTDDALGATITANSQPTSYFMVLDLDQGSTTLETQLLQMSGGHEILVAQLTGNSYYGIWGGTSEMTTANGRPVTGPVGLVTVFNGASSSIYVGALSGSLVTYNGTTGTGASGTALLVGAYTSPATHPYYNGRIAELGRYASTALTATDAQDLFEGFVAKYATSGQSLSQTVGGSTTTGSLTTT